MGASSTCWSLLTLNELLYFSLKLTCQHINHRHIKSLSVHPLPWMNVMLDCICMIFAELWSTKSKRKIQNDDVCVHRDSNRRNLLCLKCQWLYIIFILFHLLLSILSASWLICLYCMLVLAKSREITRLLCVDHSSANTIQMKSSMAFIQSNGRTGIDLILKEMWRRFIWWQVSFNVPYLNFYFARAVLTFSIAVKRYRYMYVSLGELSSVINIWLGNYGHSSY